MATVTALLRQRRTVSWVMLAGAHVALTAMIRLFDIGTRSGVYAQSAASTLMAGIEASVLVTPAAVIASFLAARRPRGFFGVLWPALWVVSVTTLALAGFYPAPLDVWVRLFRTLLFIYAALHVLVAFLVWRSSPIAEASATDATVAGVFE